MIERHTKKTAIEQIEETDDYEGRSDD